MAANTSPDSITYPTGTDQVAPLNTVFANMANSIQTAFNRRATYTYRWANAAARTAQTGMRNGDEGYQVDTDVWYLRKGNAWVPQLNTAADTGWLSSGVITAASGWTLDGYRIRRRGAFVTLSYVDFTRTGGTINTGTVGDIKNNHVVTVAAGYRVSQTSGGLVSSSTGRLVHGYINGGNGNLAIAAVAPGANITNGTKLSLSGTWIADA